MIKLLLHILLERYINSLALEMASPGNGTVPVVSAHFRSVRLQAWASQTLHLRLLLLRPLRWSVSGHNSFGSAENRCSLRRATEPKIWPSTIDQMLRIQNAGFSKKNHYLLGKGFRKKTCPRAVCQTVRTNESD